MDMFAAATEALYMIAQPERMLFLLAGVTMGLLLGMLPGVGGLVGLALLLPFTFSMDTYSAFALLLGLAAVTPTSDTIPAVLFGVPGSAGSQATVLDGLPMAKRGEAGRALSAAYLSSLIGGLFAAVVLAGMIPVLRPIIIFAGSPEMLALAVFGLSMVAILSGNAPLRGLAIACFGIMLAMIGASPQGGGIQRWTLGTLYLWDGLPLVPVILGLFAFPELCDLLISKTALARKSAYGITAGMIQGAKDVLRNWWLVIRCSTIGSLLGAFPGIGGSVIDWLAYGHAVQTEKPSDRPFGSGDVRGVIAPESANNAKEGGALIPTIAFGVPGSASMALLLGAFMIHGLTPGPQMLSTNLSFTYSLVWSVALANVFAAVACYLLSGYFAKIATLRYTLVLPVVMSIAYIGAFQASRQWGDIYVLIIFCAVGWTMKRLKWPRPPLILGFILGGTIERYLFISIDRYGFEWLMRPVVIILLGIALLALFRPLVSDILNQGGMRSILKEYQRPNFKAAHVFPMAMMVLVSMMLVQASEWRTVAGIVPAIVGWLALGFLALTLFNDMFRRPAETAPAYATPARREKIHMDIASENGELTNNQVLARAAIFFGWLCGFAVSMAIIGLLPTVFLFVIAFMVIEGREKPWLALTISVVLSFLVYYVFDQAMRLPWPPTLLGQWIPALRAFPTI